jgi:hypothetical protein
MRAIAKITNAINEKAGALAGIARRIWAPQNVLQECAMCWQACEQCALSPVV